MLASFDRFELQVFSLRRPQVKTNEGSDADAEHKTCNLFACHIASSNNIEGVASLVVLSCASTPASPAPRIFIQFPFMRRARDCTARKILVL
jgi:hypothetical protein